MTAMARCSDCGGEMGVQARACPQCGAPGAPAAKPFPRYRVLFLAAVAITLGAIGFAVLREHQAQSVLADGKREEALCRQSRPPDLQAACGALGVNSLNTFLALTDQRVYATYGAIAFGVLAAGIFPLHRKEAARRRALRVADA